MMTLHQQLREIAIQMVNEPWYESVRAPRACEALMAMAYRENWPRDSFRARVVLEFDRRLHTGDHCVPLGTPGI